MSAIDTELFKAAVANFSTSGLSRFEISLGVKRDTKVRPEAFRSELLGDNTPIEFRSLYVKGKGKFVGKFPDMGTSFFVLGGHEALQGRFNVNYLIDFVRSGPEKKLLNYYPHFFPNWMAPPLFMAINVAIVRHGIKRLRLEMQCGTRIMSGDWKANLNVSGWVEMSDFEETFDLKTPLSLTVTDCEIKLPKLELPDDW